MICFSCPECGFALEFADEASSTSVRCPQCRETITVPRSAMVAKERAEALTREIAEKHRAAGVLRRLGNFPVGHLANAAACFARGMLEGETPLALIDTSFMRNGKAGVLLTNRNLYSSFHPRPIALEHIRAVSCKGPSVWNLIALSLTILLIPGLYFLKATLPARFVPNAILFVFLLLPALYISMRGLRPLQHRLFVGQWVVYAGGHPIRSAFWVELLLALGAEARKANPGAGTPSILEGRIAAALSAGADPPAVRESTAAAGEVVNFLPRTAEQPPK